MWLYLEIQKCKSIERTDVDDDDKKKEVHKHSKIKATDSDYKRILSDDDRNNEAN